MIWHASSILTAEIKTHRPDAADDLAMAPARPQCAGAANEERP
jgi:hypothetical protein